MTIEKNGKIYTVEELKNDWKLSIMFDVVPVVYKVPKVNCPAFDELKAFVANNDAF